MKGNHIKDNLPVVFSGIGIILTSMASLILSTKVSAMQSRLSAIEQERRDVSQGRLR